MASAPYPGKLRALLGVSADYAIAYPSRIAAAASGAASADVASGRSSLAAGGSAERARSYNANAGWFAFIDEA